MNITFAATKLRSTASLKNLARACGIQTAYRDMDGKRKQASPESLISTLQAFGIEISNASDIRPAQEKLENEKRRQVLEPVIIAWDGHLKHLDVRLPDHPRNDAEADLTLEAGEKRRYVWPDVSRHYQGETAGRPKGGYRPVRLPVGERLPLGYHRLTLNAGKIKGSAFVIAAPRRIRAPADSPGRWGLFSPLYALRSESGLGAGDISGLIRLAEWSASLGAGIVATLPLLPTFLKERFNPSPYSPISRLFWNELYIDLESVPELPSCPEAAALFKSREYADEMERWCKGPMVDYGRQMAFKRRVLELLAETFFLIPSGDRAQAYNEFLMSRPKVKDYARFRAVSEERELPWRNWPERLRDGQIEDTDCRPELVRYYLYTQFIINEQMTVVAAKAKRLGQVLYLDLPLGVHPDGFDAWREQQSFVSNVSVGAPPDPVFPSGQDWGFPPLHPMRMRQNSYRYIIEVLRHHLRFAGILRLDHIMGLHRLFWIPAGLVAGDGVYVRYEPEEIYAILCLETHRRQAVIVGEDLGLVPTAVRRSMSRHGILRSYIAQYEMITENERCLDTVPQDAVAALSTHDMHPFAAFWQGIDIIERQALGVLGAEQAATESSRRLAGKASLVRCLRQRGYLNHGEPSIEEIYESVCRVLASSGVRELLISIDDLVGATQAQNIPGTTTQHPNWQRRGLKSLEELEADPEINAFLKEIDHHRKKGLD